MHVNDVVMKNGKSIKDFTKVNFTLGHIYISRASNNTKQAPMPLLTYIHWGVHHLVDCICVLSGRLQENDMVTGGRPVYHL